jgi:hypothetical protein
MGKVLTGDAGSLKGRRGAWGFLNDPPRVVVLALCAVVLACRRAEAVTHPQFWAEDSYFFERAYVIGWHALAVPFAGYLHTILRLIAELAVLSAPSRAPAIFVACSAAVTLYVAARALSRRCPLPRFAGACALAVVLVPDTSEVFLTIVNLQWVIGAGLVLVLISGDPRSRGEWIHDLVAAAAMGLTGPFCILLSPLFAWRAFSRRTRPSIVLAGVVSACAAVQGYLVLVTPPMDSGTAGGVPALGLVLPLIARRIGASVLMGSLAAADTDFYVGTAVGLATLAGVAYLASRGGRIRAQRMLLGAAFAILLAGALFRNEHALGAFFEPHARSRYLYIPQLVALWLLLSAAAEKGRAGAICGALALWALVVNIPTYREAAYVDMHWERYAPSIRSGEPVVVPINPPGWVMPLPARTK